MLLECAILTYPVAVTVSPKLGIVLANDFQPRDHPPQQDILTLTAGADRAKVLVLIQLLLAHRARHTPIRACRLGPLCPSLGVRMLVEPLSDAVPAEEMGTTGKLGTAAHHMRLADLANELLPLCQKLVLLHFGLAHLRRFELHGVAGVLGDGFYHGTGLGDDLLVILRLLLLLLLLLFLLLLGLLVRLLSTASRIVLGVTVSSHDRRSLLFELCEVEHVVKLIVVGKLGVFSCIHI
mmetsp:Transcript_106015/g.253011  ORF Transcript_106015/g.253011 Transcript_106015/m.253011 type:complete len:237 (+) Transcript_106015:1028-1738(+)